MRRLLLAVAAGLVLAAPSTAHANANSLDVRLGSCSAQLVSTSPWTANTDGTYSNARRSAVLIPRGTSIQLPILAAGPMRVRPGALSFPMDARLLPLPSDGMFGELMAGADISGPVSAGIDSGANIRRRAPSLFLDPRTTYLYFTTTNPFVIDLNKNNKGKQQRTATSRPNKPSSSSRKKPKIITTAFALDPCDPAIFFGGVNANISGITVSLEGMGFSLAGKVKHQSAMPVWTGGTRRNGQPDLRPFVNDGHVYVKGSVGVGVGGFLSIAGQAAVSMDLDPRRNGVWGLQEAVALLNGRLPGTLPDFRLLVEGAPLVRLPMLAVPFAKVAIALDATDPRRVRLQLAGERGPAGSLADLFGGKAPPGTEMIKAKGAIQLFANATFDGTATRPNGTYQVKVRGVLRLGELAISGDVDLTYRAGGQVSVCANVSTLGRTCDRDLADAMGKIGEGAVTAALDGQRFFQGLGGDLDRAFDDGLRAVGKTFKDAEHNLHGAPRCTRESKNVGQKMGEKLRATVQARAEAFFTAVRPKLSGMTPAQRAAAVNSAYQRFLDTARAKRDRVKARGQGKVANWSVNPHYGRQYANAFTAQFDASSGDLGALLDSVYRRRENVGIPWR